MTTTIAFLLVPQFSMMSFSAALEPLRSANRVSERRLFEWRLVSVDGKQVAASNGIAIAVDRPLGDLKKADIVVVCAGLEPAQFAPNHPVHHHLRRLSRHGAKVGAISAGSFILADAGLLAGRRATVHWEYAEAFAARYPTLELGRDLYIVDRGVFTCSGGTAALDLMLHFISEIASRDIAVAVAEQFIHPQIRRQEDRQRLEMHTRYGVDSPKLVEIIALMEGTIDNPLDIRRIAERADLSPRQVERLFREQVGTSPKAFYLDLRLKRARTLLRLTLQPILTVALECGFGSTSHFSHAYKRAFGLAPTDERHTGARRS
ncbi:MAG TPA: GlxA family transcriptional regulator [Steroidobacteraceae bacterium]|jgi:transcriptional regulator GlxA family with amidase domain|nr:GlxA family transcriptional regulator [Steroidobacteraceae bacterium]